MKHTPGPWFNTSENDQATGSVGTNPLANNIALCWSENAKADARLIAAAPDLLASLKLLVNYGNLGAYERADAMNEARAAIAKATGEKS